MRERHRYTRLLGRQRRCCCACSLLCCVAFRPASSCLFLAEAALRSWKYGRAPVQVASKALFKDSCRSLSFSADGNREDFWRGKRDCTRRFHCLRTQP